MKFSEIQNENQLWQFMTEPSDPLIESLKRITGSIMILGGSGKMGKELTGLIKEADKLNGHQREIFVASTFSNLSDLEDFEQMKVKCFKGDLSAPSFLNSLPDAPIVIYMMGFKFGSSNDWRRAFHLNAVVPYLVGVKYANSKIMAFSSGNPYPHTDFQGQGSKESDQLNPVGVYGWNIVARESAFQTTSMMHKRQEVCLYRLMYAQHLSYGVLVDLANMVWNNEPISVAMPSVNLISQRDANEIAIRALEHCSNPPMTLNVAGPVWPVRKIVEIIGNVMDRAPQIIDSEPEEALLANDAYCRSLFGPYRDPVEDMIEASALWVMKNGNSWNKPTFFGKVKHDY